MALPFPGSQIFGTNERTSGDFLHLFTYSDILVGLPQLSQNLEKAIVLDAKSLALGTCGEQCDCDSEICHMVTFIHLCQQ